MLNIQAELDGKNFQDIFPLFEKELQISETQLSQITKIIKEDIEKNLFTGRDYFGNNVQPLAPSTIRKKGHSRPFYESGLLFNSILSQRVTPTLYEVFVSDSRDEILSYLQLGNKYNNLPKREAFGISKNAEQQIEKVLSN